MKLNHIDDDGAVHLKNFHQERISAETPVLRRYKAHLHLGMLAWRDGDASAATTHLRAAASDAIEAYSSQSTPPPRNTNDFDLPLMLTLAFGDGDLKKRLRDLPRSSWFQPKDDEYRPLADLFDLLRAFPAAQALDADAIRRVLEGNEKPQSQLWYKPWIKAMAEGLLAIRNRNKRGVERAVIALLERHEKEADEGDWKYLVEGLMATWALVLYRFAREAGIEIDVDSPYFPKDYPE